MHKTGLTLVACLMVAGCGQSEQRSPLVVASDALNVPGVNTIEYSGAGEFFAVAQSPAPDAPWPRFTMSTYTAAVDYPTTSMRVELVREQAENPPRGGGNQPLLAPQRQILAVSGDHAWNQVGPAAAEPGAPQPQPALVAERTLQVWMTPHGFVKAAMAQNAMPDTAQGGEVTFTIEGHRVTGTIDGDGTVQRVETIVDNTVLGDMAYVAEYSDYRDFDGVLFPGRIVLQQGGHPALDLRVESVRVNAPVSIAAPEPVVNAAPAPVTATPEQIANGVYYITGGSHHSVAIEMQDHVIVVEAPQNEARSEAVIAAVRQAIPDKAIRYVINTHHHFDHSGGLRTYVDEGVTIVTHEMNRPFYERAWAEPRTLNPDRLAQSGRQPSFETFSDRHVLTDGSRTVEVHHIQGNGHNDAFAMVYLPAERILIEADAFTPGAPNAPPPQTPNPYTVNLQENIQRLGLDVQQIAPLHGRMTTQTEMARALGQ